MKILLGFLIMLLTLFLMSCEEATTIDPKSPTMAYMMMVEDLQESTTLTQNITYLAFDLTAFDMETRQQLRDLTQSFAEEHDMVHLEMTMDELIEAGYIETDQWDNGQVVPTYFTEGALFEFSDLVMTDETAITADVSVWRANLGAAFGVYEATLTDETWTLTRTSFKVA
jgi:hypothetical protein